MTDQIEIEPSGPLFASIRPPGSKSITNRALICAALADGSSTVEEALHSEDTQVMVESLQRLGLSVEASVPDSRISIEGCGGLVPVKRAELFVRNSGTTIRFLTAMLAACGGAYELDGIERMRERPVDDLLDALRQLGADATSKSGNGCPPVLIESNGLRGGTAFVRGDISSQFLSGLLMAAPYARNPVNLNVQGDLVSKPYVDMTLNVMRSFGVVVKTEDGQHFAVPNVRYVGRSYHVEPDASAASYFWAAAAITKGRITVEGLTRSAIQGDVAFCDCLQQMGCELIEEARGITVVGKPLRGITANMNAISDTMQTLAAVALFADGPTTITGVAHNRLKETDRIGDLACELRKLGAEVDELADGMTIKPQPLHAAEIQTYNDHRMAMSLSLVGLSVPGVVITDPGCTAKTYPDFFSDLRALRG